MEIINTSFNTFKSLDWEIIISNYCSSWRNYSSNAHDTYIIVLGFIFIFSIIGIFYNPRLKYYKKIEIDEDIHIIIKKIIIFLKLNIIEFDFKLMNFLKNIAVDFLIIRIFQVYFIMKLYLSGG